MRKGYLVFSVFVLIFLACTDGRQTVLEQGRQDLAYLDEIVTKGGYALTDTLTKMLQAPFATKPVYNEKGVGVNTDIVMAQNSEAGLDGSPLDLMLSHTVEALLPLLDEPERAKLWPDADSLRMDIDRAKSLRYLVVVRVFDITPIEVHGDSIFTGARAHIGYSVMDIENQKLLHAGTFHVKPDQNVDYLYSDETDREDRGRAFVRSSLWENARRKLLERLYILTGGQFRLEE